VNLAAIPSPSQGVWYLGNVPIRAYALCIVLGIVVACVVTEIRMRRRGAPPFAVLDIAVWAVPFGIVGARIYHVLTSPATYFGTGGRPIEALYIWRGGLGIWGAVLGGALGAWIACRRLGIPLTFVADAAAPGLPLAQAVGRWGNWFNNELYGRETSLPWGLKIYEWDAERGRAVLGPDGEPIVKGVFHPTFLYESLWDVGVALLVWQLDKRYRFGRGRAFALYVMAYCVGRFWIEALRTDPATEFLGMRLNNWTALVVFIGALIYFVRVRGPREVLVAQDDGTLLVVSEGAAAGPRSAADRDEADADGESEARDSAGVRHQSVLDQDEGRESDAVDDTGATKNSPGPVSLDKSDAGEEAEAARSRPGTT
jgi:prolipoprotein diacylglyceryl transferase